MASNEKEILLKKYLTDGLTPEELEQFTELRNADPELEEKIRLHEAVNASLGDSDLTDFEDFIQSSRPEIHTLDNGGNKKNTFLLIAASISFIAIISVLSLWVISLSTDTDEVYQAYYAPFPNITTYRGDSTTSAFAYGMYAYTKEDYASAVKNFKVAEETGLRDFYLGISYMALDQFESALQSLENAQRNIDEQNILYEEVLWYQALCYLKQRDISATTNMLNATIKNGGKRAIQAKDVIKLILND